MAERQGRSLREEQVEGTRQAIVSSARALFGSKGYAATSVDDIAADARVTKGAVYHHFATKEGVFRAVYDEVEADTRSRQGKPLRRDASVIDVLVHGMHTYLDATLDPEVQRITLIDAPSVLGADMASVPDDDPGHVGLRAFVSAAIDNGAIVELDPDALTHLIGGACLQAGLVIARSPNQRRTRKKVGEALEAMIRGLERAS